MNSTLETSQQPTQTSRDEALRVLQKCHAGDIDDFLSEIRQKKTTDEPSTTMSNTPETDTPETDAAVIPPNGPSSSGTVPADLCRHMEREREQFRKDYLDMKRERNSLIDQRDCATNLHEWSVRQVRDMADECNKMGRERDQWRECTERLAVSIAWSPLVPTKSMEAALAEFERLKGETK